MERPACEAIAKPDTERAAARLVILFMDDETEGLLGEGAEGLVHGEIAFITGQAGDPDLRGAGGFQFGRRFYLGDGAADAVAEIGEVGWVGGPGEDIEVGADGLPLFFQ